MKRIQDFFSKDKPLLVIGSLIVSLPFLKLFSTPVIIGYTEFFILNSRKVPDLFHAWQTINFGQNVAASFWRLFPLDAYYYALNYFFKFSPQVTHSIFLAVISIIGFISFYFFLSEFFPHIGKLSRFLGGLLFVFNAYTLLNISSSYIFAVPYFILPLQLLLTLKSLKSQKALFYIINLGLIGFMTYGINLAFSSIAVGMILITGLWQVYVQKICTLKKFALVFFSSSILTILLIIWWLAPMIMASLIDKQTTSFILNSEKFNGLDSTVLNVFRNLGEWSFFSGYKGEPYHQYARLFRDNTFFVITSFLPMLGVLAIYIVFSRRSYRRSSIWTQLIFFYLLVAVMLPVIGGTNDTWPTSGLMQWVFDHVPFAMAFRSTYKFTEISALCYTVILAVFVDYLLRGVRQGRYQIVQYTLIAGTFMSIGFINVIPLWIGDIYVSKQQVSHVPQYWDQIATYINNSYDKIHDRTLLLPDQYFPVFTWAVQRRSLPSDMTEITFNSPTVHGVCRGCAPYYTSNLISYIYANIGKTNFDKFLGVLNINHIIQRDDIDYAYYNELSPSQIKELLASYTTITFKKSFGPLSLYDIADKNVSGRIYSPKSLVSVEDFDGAVESFGQYGESGSLASFVLKDQIGRADNITAASANTYVQLFKPAEATLAEDLITQSFTVGAKGTFKLINKSADDLVAKTVPRIVKEGGSPVQPINGVYDLNKGNYSFDQNIIYSPNNLLENGNFDEGPWQSQAGNCLLQHQDAILYVSVVTDSKRGNILRLGGNQDVACVHSEKIEDFSPSNDYVASFDYKIIKGNTASYCAWDGYHCLNQKVLSAKGGWQHFIVPIKPNKTSNQLTLYLYAPADDGTPSEIDFDNVSIRKISGNVLDTNALVSSSIRAISPAKLELVSNTPTRYQLSANTTTKSLVIFSESYHPGWKAFILPAGKSNSGWLASIGFSKPGYEIDKKFHIVANGYANAWWIDPDSIPATYKSGSGDYVLILEYWPQRWFYVGLIISGATLAGCLGYLGWYGLRKRRQRKSAQNIRSRR